MVTKKTTGLTTKPENSLIIPQKKIDRLWQQHQLSRPTPAQTPQLSNWKLWWRFFWGQNQPNQVDSDLF